MAVSEQRLALFALLSEWEADARELIASHVCPDHTIADDIGAEAYEIIKGRAAKSFGSSDLGDSSLLTYIDIGDTIKILMSNRTLLTPQVSSTITKLSKQLELLPAIRNRVMHQRPLEFDDLPLATDVLRTLARSDKRQFSRTINAFEAISMGRVFEDYAKAFAFEAPPPVLNNLPQADFDDTGFMGRRDQLVELRKAIAGPFPVITVLGVGGAGKSALALQVAYDILNEPNNGFDAIIWTSAKTTRLTGADVQEIVGSISSSVGIAEAAIRELGEDDLANPFEKLKELLSHFRILLFIDNLETILDEKVRSFVRDLPSGSKVVFTSRIGLGAYDFSIPVNNLDSKHAAAYFRRVCNVWNQVELEKESKEVVSSFCTRLNNSPLGIKWFVHAISSGASPQSLLSNPKSLLSFCLENIIDKLSPSAKKMLDILAVTGREQSPASLHYIAEIESFEIEDALRELIASNLITVVVSKFGDEDRYRISALAQTYISRMHAPSAPAQERIRSKQAQLTALSERAEADQKRGYVYDPSYILIRSEFSGSDAVAATYLRHALGAYRAFDYESAFEKIAQARQIAPSFFEVARVEAYIAAGEGNTLRSQAAFEEAMALKPDYPPLAVHYAAFLVKALDDGTTAEAILRSALPHDENPTEIQTELARCLLYQHRYDDAYEELTAVDVSKMRNARGVVKYHDLLVQTCARSAETYLADGDSQQLEISMARLARVIRQIPPHALDAQLEKHLRSGELTARKFLMREGSTPRGETVAATIDAIATLLGDQPSAGGAMADLNSDRLGGTVSFIPADKPFGFIDADDGRSMFFHQNGLVVRSDFQLMKVGTPVTFKIGSNAQGQCADQVTIK